MNRLLTLTLFTLLLPATACAAGVQLGIGPFALARDGADVFIAYQPEGSRYRIGASYKRWTDIFRDPFAGWDHSKTTETKTGLLIDYLFQPETDDSFFVGGGLLKWTRTETPLLITAPSGTNSTLDPYFGGGYTGKLGKYGFYNLGMYLSPTARLQTQTTISSEESSGGFDIQLQIGVRF
jgi:hypothetical protein